MKRIPELKKLEATLRSSPLVVGGFLGNDTRILEEIAPVRFGHLSPSVLAVLLGVILNLIR